MLYSYIYSFPVGQICITASEKGVCELKLLAQSKYQSETGCAENPYTKLAYQQLCEYFAGQRKQFDFPLDLIGTEFQKTVWRELCKIPYGETVTYGELAKRIGKPKAARAVGLANHYNPIWIVVPCHRVIGANGKLTGYAGGLDMKQHLIDLERNHSNA